MKLFNKNHKVIKVKSADRIGIHCSCGYRGGSVLRAHSLRRRLRSVRFYQRLVKSHARYANRNGL